jgi:DNA (cytosine-5)-methyltransferase 1
LERFTVSKKVLVADLLCGAGGSSTGCKRACDELGLEMELVCVNHWGVALETHKRNHPEARHYCEDIAAVRPHIIVPEGYLDLLLASPTCTHHSVARGGKPTSDQQRSDPWHIVTWLTELEVKRFIIENVREYVSWGPVHPRTMRPDPKRKGEYFNAWIDTLRRLGNELEWRNLNGANYGDATTRTRFILKGRRDRRMIGWAPISHTKRQDNVLHLDDTKPWTPARDIIDWNLKGRSIFNRKKPLAPKTLARIYAGAVKFNWPEPFLVILRNHMAGRSVDQPLPTVAANGTHIGLAQPVIMNGRKGNKATGVDAAPIPTLDTKGGVWLAEPLILSNQNSGAPRSTDEPVPTITTGGAGSPRQGCARPMLVQPFILSRQSCGAPRTTDEPMPTQTTVHSPVLIAPYYGTGSGETCNSAEEPLPTVTSKGRFGMVVPVTHAGGLDRARHIETPLPTVTGANRGELAFITAQFGERDGQAPRVHDLDEPAPVGVTLGNGLLIEPTRDFDILFRMLEPHELAAAMGFNTEGTKYEFAGTKTEQIKQIGNAVCVSMMKAEVKAILADAVPKRKQKPEPMRVAAE